jgi:hypothetical protein
MQSPSWGYPKVNLQPTCWFLTTISRKMAPRMRKRLQERGRDTPTKGLLWKGQVAILYANAAWKVVTLNPARIRPNLLGASLGTRQSGDMDRSSSWKWRGWGKTANSL